jgi:hypothetical protein
MERYRDRRSIVDRWTIWLSFTLSSYTNRRQFGSVHDNGDAGAEAHFDLERLDTFGTESPGSKTKVCKFHVAGRIDKEVLFRLVAQGNPKVMFFVGTHLGLKITMDVTELVQLADCGEHLGDVEACMLFLENARIVQQCPKVASGHILHREIDMLGILKRIQKANKPGCFRRGEYVSLHKYVSNLDGRFLVEKR